MLKLTDADYTALRLALAMTHAGGTCTGIYPEWRRMEKLRKARLLSFWGRRNVRWDRTFYDITSGGRRALTARFGDVMYPSVSL